MRGNSHALKQDSLAAFDKDGTLSTPAWSGARSQVGVSSALRDLLGLALSPPARLGYSARELSTAEK
jgi:hypothetical protein